MRATVHPRPPSPGRPGHHDRAGPGESARAADPATQAVVGGELAGRCGASYASGSTAAGSGSWQPGMRGLGAHVRVRVRVVGARVGHCPGDDLSALSRVDCESVTAGLESGSAAGADSPRSVPVPGCLGRGVLAIPSVRGGAHGRPPLL